MIRDFTSEELDLLSEFANSHTARLVMELLDDRIDVIKGNILSVPLDKGPESDSLLLYAERMKLEGAVALRNAFKKKVEVYRSAK